MSCFKILHIKSNLFYILAILAAYSTDLTHELSNLENRESPNLRMSRTTLFGNRLYMRFESISTASIAYLVTTTPTSLFNTVINHVILTKTHQKDILNNSKTLKSFACQSCFASIPLVGIKPQILKSQILKTQVFYFE